MTLLPVVVRELRVASRQASTYWTRCGASLGGMLVFGWAALTMQMLGGSGQLAQSLFATLSGISFGFTLLAGVIFSADCLARERREGTLGLLFLTDLRSIDIALGKLAATSLGSIYCLLAILPVLAIPLILGGVTGAEYARMVAVLSATLWLALTTGLLASTLAPGARSAGLWAALLMLAASCGLPALAASVQAIAQPSAPVARLLHGAGEASPFAAFGAAFQAGPVAVSRRYYYALFYIVASGGLALVWATLRLPRLWQDATANIRPAARARTRATRAATLPTTPGNLQAHGPIAWLCNRSSTRRWFPWALLAALGATWLALLGWSDNDWNDVPGWVATSLTVHFCLKMWMAAEAPRVFHEERRSGGTELLLTTGLSNRDFVRGRIGALRQLYRGPCAAVTGVDLVLLMANYRQIVGHGDERIIVLAFWLGRMAMLWFDVEALAWTGTWISVATRGQRTIGPTWARVVLLPYVLGMLTAMILWAGSFSGIPFFVRLGNAAEHIGIVASGLLALNLGVSAAWWAWAARRLQGDFRARFAQPLGVRKSP